VCVWGDTPEIEALGAEFAREKHFFEGSNNARNFANTFTADATAVAPGQHHAQISWGLGKYHPSCLSFRLTLPIRYLTHAPPGRESAKLLEKGGSAVGDDDIPSIDGF
jgi:hypothetical protein